MKSYLIIDIGTGNVRVALVDTGGQILDEKRDTVIYKKDDKYKEGLYFDPDYLWKQIEHLIDHILDANRLVEIIAVTASSQREGIVLLDKKGDAMIGFPNHDHRGRFLEDTIKDKDMVYKITGRYPTSLFSALKLIAYREKYPIEWKQFDCFLSISDWAQYQLTGIKGYEHAQASETILYDVEHKQWSKELLDLFTLKESMIPPLYFSGTKLGNVTSEYIEKWNLQDELLVLVGGADTQLAIKSTQPEQEDIVLVSGTTTPVVNIVTEYVLDEQQRSWTNSHLDKEQYILETNCGVTGLNYQRVKEIFYPKDSYDTIEKEIDELHDAVCFANLGSLIAGDKKMITRGGFLFDVPIMTALSRADFAFATIWDIACSIKKNYDSLLDIKSNQKDYVWGCGGGFQSRHLKEFVAGLLNKKLYIRQGFEQASVSGGAVVCGEALGYLEENKNKIEVIEPKENKKYKEWFRKWEETRRQLAGGR